MGSFRDLTKPRALRILLPVGVVLAAISGYRIWDEARVLDRAIAVDAEVVAARVEDWVTGTGTNRERRHKPVVTYRYEFDGARFESSAVTPLDLSGSAPWARALVDRFPPGTKTRAYVDPDDPSRAFLVREESWKPKVGVVLGTLIALATGIGLLRHRARAAEADAPDGL